MLPRAKIAHRAGLARFDELPLTNVPLFEEETISGCLLGFLPGLVLPRHRPRYKAGPPHGSELPVWLTFGLLNSGVLAVCLAPWIRVEVPARAALLGSGK
jgi:hypothetical protein